MSLGPANCGIAMPGNILCMHSSLDSNLNVEVQCQHSIYQDRPDRQTGRQTDGRQTKGDRQTGQNRSRTGNRRREGCRTLELLYRVVGSKPAVLVQPWKYRPWRTRCQMCPGAISPAFATAQPNSEIDVAINPELSTSPRPVCAVARCH